MPQYFEPGSAVFGQRLPLVRIAAQRPENSSSAPPNAASASVRANSVSETMSIFQPVSRAARRAFRPSLPMASESWSSGTTTVASFVSSSTSTSRADAGANGIHALHVRLDSDLRAVTRLPRHAADLHEPIRDLGHFELEQGLDQLRIAP